MHTLLFLPPSRKEMDKHREGRKYYSITASIGCTSSDIFSDKKCTYVLNIILNILSNGPNHLLGTTKFSLTDFIHQQLNSYPNQRKHIP